MASNIRPTHSSDTAPPDLAVQVSRCGMTNGVNTLQQTPCSESGDIIPQVVASLQDGNSTVQFEAPTNSFSQESKLKNAPFIPLAYSTLDDIPETAVERRRDSAGQLEFSGGSTDTGFKSVVQNISDVSTQSLNTLELTTPLVRNVPVSTIYSLGVSTTSALSEYSAASWCSDSPSILLGVSELTYPLGSSPVVPIYPTGHSTDSNISEKCGNASPSKLQDLRDSMEYSVGLSELSDPSMTSKITEDIEVSVESSSSSSSSDSPFIFEPPPLPSPPLPPPLPPPRSQCSSDTPLSCTSAALYRQSSGPPPSYSYVMERDATVQQVITRPTYSFIPPVPPPSYAQAHGIFGDPTHFLAVSHVVWGRQPMPALCPQCGTLVLTVISKQDSLITHLSAVLLCMLGCWPCCLVPYCLDICKNTYHYCPVCRLILGVYNPRRGLS